MKKFGWLLSLVSVPLWVAAAPVELTPQTVKADFRQTQVQQLPEAITVVGAQQINARSAEHLEQILSFAPNVNFSAGSSRGRFFQIRGIGERSQFIDPVNPSVGLMIDGIDMTGLGAAATLFDVEQVEILRGPQGTRFGANALAGIINVSSVDPSTQSSGYVSTKSGNYGSTGIGGAVGGRLNKTISGRIAVHRFSSDGYMRNDYVQRQDTQDLNEDVVRAKLLWQPTTDSELQLTYLYAKAANGYDAFTLDNSRHSLADEPGEDNQDTQAWALAYKNQLNAKVQFESTLTGSHSTTDYNFDEDWVYPALHPDTYSSFDDYHRTFKRGSVDMRFLSTPAGRVLNQSTDWVLGFYALTRDEQLQRQYRYETDRTYYQNNLAVRSTSVYSELTTQLSPRSRIIYGVRLEHWQNDFDASDAVQDATNEWLVGGKTTVEYMLNYDHLGYLSYARGYKAGGINSDSDIALANRTFTTEYNNAFELGVKSAWLDNDLTTRMALFYIQRKDQQVKSSYVIPGLPPTFMDYLANAAEGRNYGLELESHWQLGERLLWELSYGYLNTEFIDYSRSQNILDSNYDVIGSEIVDKTGRAQAHAPKHSGATALTYTLWQALSLRLEAEAKDTFFFSDSHDEQAPGYVLYHARLSYAISGFELAISGRNLGNIDTQTRGFSFPNDPRDGWLDHKYVQLGEPRLVMLEGKYQF